MKMMKLLIPALAITAWAHTALATLTTPIYEIRACDVNGAAVTEPVASSTTPLKGGDTVRFVIRTLNPEFDTLAGSATTHWQLNYIGLGTAAADMISAPPAVGVVVNGQTRMAKYVKATYPTAYPFYTDFIFEYEVQPGDIALPIRLAADINGNAAGTGTSVYWFNSDLWEISKVGDPTVKVSSLKFASTAQIAIADALGQPDGLPANSNNWDGYVSGFYAQTVGFAEQSATYEGVAYWSVVNQGSTTCTPIPTISVTGDPTAASKLYIWSGDDTIAEVVPGNDIVSVKTVPSMPDQTGTGYLANVQVGEIKVVKGQSDYKFKVQGKAGQKGKKVKLYLSENPNGFFKQASGDVTDYIEVEIIVGDSLVPNISLAGPTSVTVGPDYENAIGTITLTVSEPLPTTEPDNLVVTLTPSLVTAATVSDYVHMDYKNDGSSWATLPPYSFTLKKGETSGLTHTLYLFGLGADTLNTATAANPVNFDVTVTEETSGTDVTTSCYYKMPSTLPVRFVPQKPALSADSLAVSAIGNIDRSFEIKIADNYKNLNDTTGYSIEYKKDISESDWTAMSNKWKRDSVTGILVRSDDASKLPVIKFTAGTYTTQFRVVTPAGDVKSDPITFTVTASAPAQSQAYYIDSSNTWQVTGTVTEGDTTPVTVGVRLTKANDTGDTIYAFLAPSTTLPDTTHSTFVRSTGKMFTTDANPVGMPILNGETESDPGTLYVLDGSAGETLCYTVVLSTDQNDPTQVVPGYESKTFKLNALNAVPTIKQVKMGGVKVTESGKTFAGAVPQNANRTFSVVVNDTKADRTAAAPDQFEYTWVVEEEGGLTLDPGGYGTVTGDPNATTATFNYTFQLTGTAKITLNLKDKDMSDYGEDFVFYVKVGSQPNVSVVNVDGINFFDETTIGPNNARMRVILSEPAAVDLTVQLTVKYTHADPGILELGGATDLGGGVYTLVVPANTTTKDFYIKNLDGTLGSSLEGWTIEGEVTTATASLKDPTKTWAQYYLHGEYYCTVDNVEPTFNCSLGEENTVSNAIAAAIGNGAAVTFSISDIKADLAAGVKVTWWSTDIGTRPGDSFVLNDSDLQSYTPKFTSAGIKTVKVTVEDKDAKSGIGSFTRQWYYDVAASKTLSTLAHGPSAGTSTSALSQHYTAASGLGSGHVWADGTFAGAGGFKIDWNMGTRNVANFYGYGYKPGNTGVGVLDDGNIAGERDIPIDINGDNNTEDGTVASFIASGATPYTSTITDKDSFLYTWLVTTASEGGGMVSQICGSVSPERNGLAAAVGQIALPTAKTDDGTYVETMLEAIFAQEWRTTDNCGDINQDGIPDVAVMKYGFGIYSDGTLDAMNDLTDLSTYNEDADYLPADNSAGIKIIPGLTNSWAKAAFAFNAKLEIRGYGEGLNNGTTDMTGVSANVGLAGVNSDATPDWEAWETAAWNSLGQPAGWSPERPTDPTKADTDGDDLPDGYEYYFWYRAHVCDPYTYTKDGVVRRLSGHRYNAHHPEDGELITWSEIETAFDPLRANPTEIALRDTDNDGISDLEEFVLGTSPIEWDTDSDGMSDYWELTYSNLSPITATTDGVHHDGTWRNDDNDFMARVEIGMYVLDMIDPATGRPVYFASSDLTALAGTTDSATGPVIVFQSKKDAGRVYAYSGANAALIRKVTVGTTDYFYLTEDMALANCRRVTADGVTADYVVSGVYDPTVDLLQNGTEVTPVNATAPNTTYTCFHRIFAGTASAAGDFGGDCSYKLWLYGNTGKLAMGIETDVPATYEVISAPHYETGILLNHWQVYQWRGFQLDDKLDMGTGFNPLTGWIDVNKNSGYAHGRWVNSGVGAAEDTDKFCSLDEFLLNVFAENSTGNELPVVPSIAPGANEVTFDTYYSRYTTVPENRTNDAGEVTTYGADSDRDGVPDGWEMYVQAGPGTSTKHFDASNAANATDSVFGARHYPTSDPKETGDVGIDPITGDSLADGLTERQEFWGTDSTAAYASVATIADVTGLNAKWLNKFWPTDPWSSDTDCDGVDDLAEAYAEFLYGSPSVDSTSRCFQGAGLNPCAWDTDMDGLPDAWELKYSGFVYPHPNRTFAQSYTDVQRRDILARGALDETTQACYGGMDGTVMDAYTGQLPDTINRDYDYDGLQNWQEYLTGTIRAFRYDDTTSPWAVYDYDTDPVVVARKMIEDDTATYPIQTPPDFTDAVKYPGGLTDPQFIADSLDYSDFLASLEDIVEPWVKGTIPAAIGTKLHTPPASYATLWTSYDPLWTTNPYPLSPLYTQADLGIEGAGVNPRGICDTLDWITMYGSVCRRSWDRAAGHPYFFPDGPNHVLKRYANGTARMAALATSKLTAYNRRIMDEVAAGTIPAVDSLVQFGYPRDYFGADPTKFDTDGDGMDDYYELFHGLNPMYGGLPVESAEDAGDADAGTVYDLLAQQYGGHGTIITAGAGQQYVDNICATNNFWTYVTPGAGTDAESAKYDFAKFPWMNGGAEADPDGDGIRNLSEAIQANVQANKTHLHTDPSPLWMTDSSYHRSIVTLSYRPVAEMPQLIDEDIDDQWLWGTTSGWKWSFEENEGFDTDGDWYNDFREGQKGTDPQVADSPNRRQAMYFPGNQSAVQVQEDSAIGMLLNGDSAEQFFTTFTVECWARPDSPTVVPAAVQVLLERTIQVGNSNPGDVSYLRRNFQLGIDENGYWFAAFDNDGTGTQAYGEVKTVSPVKALPNTWTHLAATYDGTALRLYVDGQPAATPAPSTLRPVTGALSVQTILNYYSEARPIYQTRRFFNADGSLSRRMIDTYIRETASKRAIIMGAGVDPAAGKNASSLAVDEHTDFQHYANYYAGYLDEVRIWDGARSATEIANNYLVRMTMDDIASNRNEIFDGLMAGQTRDLNQAEVDGELPAELVYHFSFDNLASAEAAGSIAQGPFGMDATSPDARYMPSVPAGWVSPWWANISSDMAAVGTPVSVKSTVYGLAPYSMIPWIKNTVAHLPNYDGTSRDTCFWKEAFAGDTPASEVGRTKYAFPRNAEPYARVQLVTGGYGHSDTQNTTAHLYDRVDEANGSYYYYLYRFQRRNDALMNTDALPLGGAYAKYAPDMWDNQGATTTSEISGVDADNNGVPDWADAELGSAGLGMGDTITYPAPPATGGLTDTVAHHLARLLARGATRSDPTAAAATYRQTADFNSSGLPDWWEDMYNVSGNGLADDDNDGLSNYTEYLLSEVFNTSNYTGGKVFNPVLPRSIDQHTLDYFCRFGNLYAGEIFTDHDQVEDAWEDNNADTYSTRIAYDANRDSDGDGWSMRSEARYSQMVKTLSADGTEHYNVPGDRIVDLPVPTLELAVNYSGSNPHEVSDKGLVVYVRRSGGANADFDAKYVVQGVSTNTTESSSSSTSNAYTQVIGKWSNRHVIGTLTPGNIKRIAIEDAYTPDADVITWRSIADNGAITNFVSGTRAEYLRAKSLDTTVTIISHDNDYHELTTVNLRYDEASHTATIYMNEAQTIEFGTVNLLTGEYDLDFGALAGRSVWSVSDPDSKVRAEDCTYRIVYDVNPSHGMPRTVYLGQADVGAVKEGKNDIIVVADKNEDGLYTPGEPMGVATGVDIGWRRGAASVTLTETSPISIRMDLATGDNDRTASWGAWADAVKEGDNEVLSSSLGKYVRVRVVRAYFNEKTFGGEWFTTPVLDRIVNLESELGKFLTEADFISAESPDVDWQSGTVYAAADVDATNVQYRVVFGNQELSNNETVKDTAKYMFSRRFDSNGNRANVNTIAPDSSGNFVVNDIRPTFRWKLAPEALDTYTAFQVVITGAAFKYDSGVQRAPAKNEAGEYVWTAPICVSDRMAGAKFDGDTSTGVYANNATYAYTLYMYNSKFQTQANGGTGSFYLSVPEDGNQAYGSIGAKVRYFGPNTTAIAAPGVTTQVYGGKTVHLQAFTSPDFAGEPVASTAVDPTGIDGTAPVTATLYGLNAGTYYLRAFIDSDDNGVCDDWESSGYLCGQGSDGVSSIYNPVGVRFTPQTLGTTPEVEINIEDADTNQNTVPDAWEYAKNPTNWRDLPPVGVGTYGKLGIAYATGVGTDTLNAVIPAKASPMSVSGGMAGRVLLALSNPTVAALSMGYDTLEDALSAADTLDESASVVAITSLALDGTTATVGYTTDVNTVMSATAAKSAFYVTSGTTLSFQLVVKTKANLADTWTVADTRTVTVELGAEKSGEITVDVGALPEVAGFMTIELKK